MFDRLSGGYSWSLRLVLGHRRVMLVVFVAVIAATVRMYNLVPKGFIPDTDNDSLNVNIGTAQGTSFYEAVGYTHLIGGAKRNPELMADLEARMGADYPEIAERCRALALE